MKRLGHPETPFPVGVEYYRAPTPKQECWDGDFCPVASGRVSNRAESLVLERDGAATGAVRVG